MAKEFGHFTKENSRIDGKDLKRFSSSLAITTVRGHSRSLEGLDSRARKIIEHLGTFTRRWGGKIM